MRNTSTAAITICLFLVSAIPAVAQPARAPEVYSGTSAAVSAIESRENGVIVTRDESSTAENEQERGPGASEQSKEAAYQDLTDSDWWWENDALTFGYLPGFYGGGFYGGCGAAAQPSWTGPASTQWWNAPGTSAWFPTGKPLPFPYGSGGYGCGAYNYASSRSALVFVNKRTSARKNKHHHQQAGAQPRRAVNNARTTSNGAQELANDDWTRVEDVHFQRTDAAAKFTSASTRLRGMRISGQRSPTWQKSVQRAHAAGIRIAQNERAIRMRASLASHSMAAHPASVHVTAARVGGGHRRT